MGEHRLAVGDTTDPAVIERLLDGARPAMVFTDAPYGVREPSALVDDTFAVGEAVSHPTHIQRR